MLIILVLAFCADGDRIQQLLPIISAKYFIQIHYDVSAITLVIIKKPGYAGLCLPPASGTSATERRDTTPHNIETSVLRGRQSTAQHKVEELYYFLSLATESMESDCFLSLARRVNWEKRLNLETQKNCQYLSPLTMNQSMIALSQKITMRPED